MAWSNIGCILIFILLSAYSNLAAGGITCDFTNDFCGWTHTAEGGHWERYAGSPVNAVRPPAGTATFAFVMSEHESYAHLESEEVVLNTTCRLTFRAYQTRSEFSSNNNMAELLAVPSDGSEPTVLWSLRNAKFSWNPLVEVTLDHTWGAFKLRFRFRVGSVQFFAGVADIVLSSNENEPGFIDDGMVETVNT